jgi:Lon protease-like protein
LTSETLSLFPLDAVLFPGGPIPLRVFEPRYLDMVSCCMKENLPFGILLILPDAKISTVKTVFTGTTARITDWYQGSDGILGITAVGVERFQLRSFTRKDDGLYVGSIEILQAEPRQQVPDEYHSMGALLKVIINDLGKLYENIETHYDDATWVGHRFAEILAISTKQKQHCLEIDDAIERLKYLQPMLRSIGRETSQ